MIATSVYTATFCDRLYRRSAHADAEIDLIFKCIDTLLYDENMSYIGEILSVVDLQRITPSAIRALLCITYPAKDRLVGRAAFVTRAREALTAKIGSERTELVLRNVL